MNILTARSCESIANSLREFGYPSVTAKQVREICNKLFAGDYSDIECSDIIAMMVKRMCEESGVEFPPKKL